MVGEVTEGSTHIVVFFSFTCDFFFDRELRSRGPRSSFCFSFILVFTASIGKSFGSGEQCQNWRESPKASGSTNSYDDVTW